MKNKFFILLIGACTTAFISGCASTQQFVALPNQTQPIEDSTKGRIYVLRPEPLYSGALRMKVRDGSLKIGNLGPGSFLSWERPPGKTIVFLDYDIRYADTIIEMPEELDVEAGKVYYLFADFMKQSIGFSEETNQLDSLSRLDDAKGEHMLKRCSPPSLASPKAK